MIGLLLGEQRSGKKKADWSRVPDDETVEVELS